jgi:hypothetical protein
LRYVIKEPTEREGYRHPNYRNTERGMTMGKQQLWIQLHANDEQIKYQADNIVVFKFLNA